MTSVMGHIPPSSHPGSVQLCYNFSRRTYIILKGRTCMASLPPIEESEGNILYRAGTGLAYITLVIGYLYTILTTSHLTPLNFLVFTALQMCYSALLWWMLRMVWKSPKEWRPVLAIVLLVSITEVVGLLPVIGLQWDWL